MLYLISTRTKAHTLEHSGISTPSTCGVAMLVFWEIGMPITLAHSQTCTSKNPCQVQGTGFGVSSPSLHWGCYFTHLSLTMLKGGGERGWKMAPPTFLALGRVSHGHCCSEKWIISPPVSQTFIRFSPSHLSVPGMLSCLVPKFSCFYLRLAAGIKNPKS